MAIYKVKKYMLKKLIHQNSKQLTFIVNNFKNILSLYLSLTIKQNRTNIYEAIKDKTNLS